MTAGLHITPYLCPMPGCVGGQISDGNGGSDRCLHCSGSGLTDDPMGGAERAPRPPGVMRTGCADCAFRAGSPELEENGARLPDDEPFFCHQGLPISADGRYQPVATFRGLPLGAMVCAGWWAMRTGEELPATPYREVPIGEDGIEERWAGPARRNIERAVEGAADLQLHTTAALGARLKQLTDGTQLSGLADLAVRRAAERAVKGAQR